MWRTDLVDGLIGALIKEDLNRAGQHPLLNAIHEVLRGGQRGLVAAGTVLPPVVLDIQAQLKAHDLDPRGTPREIDLVLETEAARPRSQVLHRVRLLEIAGYERTAGTDLASREEVVTIQERWRIAWSPDFDARCIEAARYGVSLADAAANALAERASAIERDAGAASLLLLDAALAGLADLAWRAAACVVELIRGEDRTSSTSPGRWGICSISIDTIRCCARPARIRWRNCSEKPTTARCGCWKAWARRQAAAGRFSTDCWPLRDIRAAGRADAGIEPNRTGANCCVACRRIEASSRSSAVGRSGRCGRWALRMESTFASR